MSSPLRSASLSSSGALRQAERLAKMAMAWPPKQPDRMTRQRQRAIARTAAKKTRHELKRLLKSQHRSKLWSKVNLNRPELRDDIVNLFHRIGS